MREADRETDPLISLDAINLNDGNEEEVVPPQTDHSSPQTPATNHQQPAPNTKRLNILQININGLRKKT